MQKIVSLFFFIVSISCFAQDTKGTIKVKKVESANKDTIQSTKIIAPVVMYVDQMPFLANMLEFIQTNIKYPEAEKKAKIQGLVYVGFVVEIDGSLSNVRIVRGLLNGSGCDAEALRIVKMMPKWTPGKDKGKNVPVQCTLPIRFTL